MMLDQQPHYAANWILINIVNTVNIVNILKILNIVNIVTDSIPPNVNNVGVLC